MTSQPAAPHKLGMDENFRHELKPFLLALLALVIFEDVLAWVTVPIRIIPYLSLIVIIIGAFVPFAAIFLGSRIQWNATRGIVLLILGLVLQFGGTFVLGVTAHASQTVQAVMTFGVAPLTQAGLILWTMAIGALISTLIKEKNLILPIAIFLAALDVFLVLTPNGITKRIVESHPEVLAKVGYHVPTVVSQPHAQHLMYAALIGPADFLFFGMFFVALHRFKMRSKATFYALTPTLILYLMVVLFAGSVGFGNLTLAKLPALLPIGVVVLIMNRKEFSLNKEELLATLMIGLIGIGLVGYGATRSAPVSGPDNGELTPSSVGSGRTQPTNSTLPSSTLKGLPSGS